MKFITKKQLNEIELINYNKGYKDGMNAILEFFKTMKNINIYNKPMTINTDKEPIIKNSLFHNNKYGILVNDLKENK